MDVAGLPVGGVSAGTTASHTQTRAYHGTTSTRASFASARPLASSSR